mgnify:FL=1|jgi:hypothetical protein
MPVTASRVHLPLYKIREIEGDCQSRDFFWWGGYEKQFDTPKNRKKDLPQKQEERTQEYVGSHPEN